MSKKKTTKDKNLDSQIDFAIDDTRCTLCKCEKCRVLKYESVPFTAHAAVIKSDKIQILELKNNQ